LLTCAGRGMVIAADSGDAKSPVKNGQADLRPVVRAGGACEVCKLNLTQRQILRRRPIGSQRKGFHMNNVFVRNMQQDARANRKPRSISRRVATRPSLNAVALAKRMGKNNLCENFDWEIPAVRVVGCCVNGSGKSQH